MTLKRVILCLFYFKNNFCLGKTYSHFCLVYGNVFLKCNVFNFISRARELNILAAVLKKIPPPATSQIIQPPNFMKYRVGNSRLPCYSYFYLFLRFFVGTWILYCLILGSSYRGEQQYWNVLEGIFILFYGLLQKIK